MKPFDPNGIRRPTSKWAAAHMNESDRDPCPIHHLNFCKIDPGLRYKIILPATISPTGGNRTQVEIGCRACGETWSVPADISLDPGKWAFEREDGYPRLHWKEIQSLEYPPPPREIHTLEENS